jgi:hypothetical protein
VNIHALVRELSDIQGSAAVLRILHAHGLTHAVGWSKDSPSHITCSDSMEDIIDRIAKQRGQKA